MFPRALCWTRLLPADAAYVCGAVPTWLEEGLKALPSEGKRQVLVLEERSLRDLPSLDPVYGVVVLDGSRSTARRLRQAGLSHVRRFAAMPSWRDLRTLIPLGSSAATAAAFGLHAPVRSAARLKNLAVRTIARAGCRGWHRGSLLIAQREPSAIERILTKVFDEQIAGTGRTGDPPALEIAISTSNAKSERNRKLLMAVLNRRGDALGFAKLSLSADSISRIEHEGEMLRILERRAGTSIKVPRLLFDGWAEQCRMIVTGPLAGRVPGAHLTTAHQTFLRRLESGDRKPVEHTRFFQSLRERAAKIANEESFSQWLNRLAPLLQATVLPTTIVHRDFAPWNLRRQDSAIAAFDWEAAELEGPPLLDEIHHMLVVAYFLERRTADQAAYLLRQFALSGPLGLPSVKAIALQIIYLIDHLCSLLEDGYSTNYPKYVWWRRVFSGVAESAHALLPADGFVTHGSRRSSLAAATSSIASTDPQ